jgi:hypothetical protein
MATLVTLDYKYKIVKTDDSGKEISQGFVVGTIGPSELSEEECADLSLHQGNNRTYYPH